MPYVLRRSIQLPLSYYKDLLVVPLRISSFQVQGETVVGAEVESLYDATLRRTNRVRIGLDQRRVRLNRMFFMDIEK